MSRADKEQNRWARPAPFAAIMLVLGFVGSSALSLFGKVLIEIVFRILKTLA
jgi:hypothetical protein